MSCLIWVMSPIVVSALRDVFTIQTSWKYMREAFSYTYTLAASIRAICSVRLARSFIISSQFRRTIPDWPTSHSTVFKRSFKSDGVTDCMVYTRACGRRVVSVSSNLIQSWGVLLSCYNKLQVLDVINCERTLQFDGCCSVDSLKGKVPCAVMCAIGANNFHSTDTSFIFLNLKSSGNWSEMFGIVRASY